MRTLAYLSRASASFDARQLGDLLDDARSFNAEHALTGVLLHAHGMFLQMLEGEAIAIDDAMRRIRKSRKHDNVIVICDEPIVDRLFPAWAMGWPGNVTGTAAVQAVLGAATPLPERATPEQADMLKILEAFLRDDMPQAETAAQMPLIAAHLSEMREA